MKRKGTVVQVTGPVVDVAFDGGSLPEINEALSVAPDGQPRMMEVAQHIGGDTVRCIMLSPSEGLGRGMAVTATMSDGTPPSSARANTRSPSSTRRPPAKRPSR